MFIEEANAKKLLAGMGIPTPGGRTTKRPAQAAEIAAELGVPVVVKAQVPTGKRGKGGGIRMADTPADVERTAQEIIGSMINGFVVHEVLVEERANIAHELYASITLDPSNRCPLLIFSTAGGMDIEEIHEKSPERVQMIPLDIREGLTIDTARRYVSASGVGDIERGKSVGEQVAQILVQLYALYRQYDAQLVEVNPLAVTIDGKVIALDCKLVIDDSALFRQPDIATEHPIGTALELEAKAQDFLFVELDGDVGVLANGAGLTMSTMDAVTVHGGRPANFLEVGGMAYKRATPALALVLKNPKVKSLLVNLCGAYARTDVIAEGIIAGWKELQPDIPVAFCIHGTGEERANQLIREELGVEPFELMDDAVKAAIEMAKK